MDDCSFGSVCSFFSICVSNSEVTSVNNLSQSHGLSSCKGENDEQSQKMYFQKGMPDVKLEDKLMIVSG